MLVVGVPQRGHGTLRDSRVVAALGVVKSNTESFSGGFYFLSFWAFLSGTVVLVALRPPSQPQTEPALAAQQAVDTESALVGVAESGERQPDADKHGGASCDGF